MNSVNSSAGITTQKPGLIAGFAKTQLLKRLQRLPRGTLIIKDGDEIHSFGTSANELDVCGRIEIHDCSAYRDIAFGGSIGSAQAYILGKWSSPSLVDVIRLMSVNIEFLNELDDSKQLLQRFSDKFFHWFNRNTENKARENIARHYDLSNEFFGLFLDPEMMYSAAVFPRADADLDEAALYKIDLICRKLDLQPSDHLLEIGTGWGGLAIHAAKHYGCRVTTTTISREQYNTASQRVKEEGLEDKITLLFEDYRNLSGRFDKLVSVEMIEAVGHEFYKQYFSGCATLLNDDGLMLLQTITIPDQRFKYAQKSVDFIQRYIFPGGSLPSHEAIITSVRSNTDMLMVGMQEIGPDYAKTLKLWRERFIDRLDEVRALGFDDHFIRMWIYYLCYCQGGFEERVIGTAQILLAKPGWRSTQTA